MSYEEITQKLFSIIDDKKYLTWRKRFRISVGAYPVDGLYVEKGENEMKFKGTDEELLTLLSNSIEQNKDLITPMLSQDKSIFSKNPAMI